MRTLALKNAVIYLIEGYLAKRWSSARFQKREVVVLGMQRLSSFEFVRTQNLTYLNFSGATSHVSSSVPPIHALCDLVVSSSDKSDAIGFQVFSSPVKE